MCRFSFGKGNAAKGTHRAEQISHPKTAAPCRWSRPGLGCDREGDPAESGIGEQDSLVEQIGQFEWQ
jgi:hypothetical protein